LAWKGTGTIKKDISRYRLHSQLLLEQSKASATNQNAAALPYSTCLAMAISAHAGDSHSNSSA
jgi:hypothetical protein